MPDSVHRLALAVVDSMLNRSEKWGSQAKAPCSAPVDPVVSADIRNSGMVRRSTEGLAVLEKALLSDPLHHIYAMR